MHPECEKGKEISKGLIHAMHSDGPHHKCGLMSNQEMLISDCCDKKKHSPTHS
jgi:hypothetical protein